MRDLANSSLPEIVISSGRTTQTLPGLVSMEDRMIFDHFISVFSAFVVCIFGIITNIINIIVFYRQGLDNTMNITFFTLAISDLGSLITFQGSAIFIHPSLYASELPFDFVSNQYIITGWPHICFGNITGWITVYITAERCLCIALPLKVKQIITPKVTTIIITVIYAANILSIVPDYIYTYLDYQWFSSRNASIITLTFRQNLKGLEGVSFFAMGILGSIPFPTVIIFTVILVVKLRQQTIWRQKSTKDSQKAQLTSKREIRTMNMVVLIAVVLIICYIPGVLVSANTFIFPSFNVKGRYVNIWFMTWAFAFLGHGISSSVNIFLYYTMSTRYKKEFHELFHCCAPKVLEESDG